MKVTLLRRDLRGDFLVCSPSQMRCVVFIFLLLPALVARADETFKKDVLPVLQKHCFGCHGKKKQKGDLRLDTLDPDIIRGTSAERWHDALNKLNLGEMPPGAS